MPLAEMTDEAIVSTTFSDIVGFLRSASIYCMNGRFVSFQSPERCRYHERSRSGNNRFIALEWAVSRTWAACRRTQELPT